MDAHHGLRPVGEGRVTGKSASITGGTGVEMLNGIALLPAAQQIKSFETQT